MQPLGLGIVAALTPDSWDIEILDENFDVFDNRDADLVGFTALTSQVTRAYELAKYYQERNIPTVLGGIHASMITEEAEKFMDVVVVGEAESVWSQVIEDFENNNLKKVYKGELMSMDNSPSARYDLFSDKYGLGALQTTRGCPMSCDFCSVHAINGRKYRYRPVEDVVRDFVNIPQDRIYIVDDDFFGYSKKAAERAKDICRGIIDSGVNKMWYTFTSMHLANDPEALDLMSKAGCRMVLLGIESEKIEQLQFSNKKTNLKFGVNNYEEVFAKFHEYGIAVLGSMIFGLEGDTAESIVNRAEYYVNSGMDCIQAGVLTPLPGTGTYYRMLENNMITLNDFPQDWEKFTFFNTVFTPSNMSFEELDNAMRKAWDIIYDEKVIKKKYLKTLKTTKNPLSAGWSLATNIHYRNVIFENIKDNYCYINLYKQLSGVELSF